MKRRQAPARIWLIVDSDPDQSLILTWERTRRDARDTCRRANLMTGYPPTCRVVEYRATPSGGAAR